MNRYVSIVVVKIRHGRLYPSVSTSVWTAVLTTVTSVYISLLSALLFSIVCLTSSPRVSSLLETCVLMWMGLGLEWQWEQLRTMKVGGNESATKYFQSHGGSAALASKDPKVKYGSNTATKYKEELKRRSAEDAKLYPPQASYPY